MPSKLRPCVAHRNRDRFDRESGVFEQRAVVFPARVADPDLRRAGQAAQEIGADLETAGAAQGLHGDDARFSLTAALSAPKRVSCTARS
jgi:hypothetical protein